MRTKLPLFLVFAGFGSLSYSSDLVLVAKDTPPAPIIVFKDAPPRTREIADVLAGYVEKISGQKPAVIEGEPSPVPEHAIWVGVQPAVKRLFPKVNFDFKHPEEIVIAANEKHVVIAGRDRWDPAKLDIETREGVIKGVQQEYGTINAVYTFLQDQLGVRWFWPGEIGEDVPKSDRIAISAPLEYRHHPQMRARGSMFNYCRLGNKGYGKSQEWTLRQRLQLDSLSIEGGHGFGDWWDRYHEKYPEIFALQPDGTRSGHPSPHNAKLCMSNPKVWELWLEEVAAELQQDPHRTVFNASPNDGWASGHCVCEKCSAWDHPDGVWEHWATVGPLYYIMAQLAWNPATDADAVLKDYYDRAFGAAAPHVREYFETIEKDRMAFMKRASIAGKSWTRRAGHIVWWTGMASLVSTNARVPTNRRFAVRFTSHW